MALPPTPLICATDVWREIWKNNFHEKNSFSSQFGSLCHDFVVCVQTVFSGPSRGIHHRLYTCCFTHVVQQSVMGLFLITSREGREWLSLFHNEIWPIFWFILFIFSNRVIFNPRLPPFWGLSHYYSPGCDYNDDGVCSHQTIGASSRSSGVLMKGRRLGAAQVKRCNFVFFFWFFDAPEK